MGPVTIAEALSSWWVSHWSSVAWRTPFDSRPTRCWSGPSRISSPAGALPDLPLSGCLLGPSPARDREGRASPRRVVPAGRLHRDYADRDQSGRRPLLQRARDGGAVDQGGQGRDPLDASLLPPLPRERGPPVPGSHRL